MKVSYMLPFVQVGQVDLSICIDMFPGLNHHCARWFHETNGRVVGVRVQEPQTHRNIIYISYKEKDGEKKKK